MAAVPFTHRQRLTLLATGIGLFMIFLDATIVNVALPDIQQRLRRRRAGPAVGRRRLQPHDGHVHHVGGHARRPARPPPGVHRRDRGLLRRVRHLCGRARPVRAQRRPRPPGRRRGDRERGVARPGRAPRSRTRRRRPGPSACGPASPSVGLAIGPTVGGFLTEAAGGAASSSSTSVIGAIGIVLARAVRRRVARPDQCAASTSPASCCSSSASARSTYALIEGPHTGWTVAASSSGCSSALVALGVGVRARSSCTHPTR